jgi:hypothetical protein
MFLLRRIRKASKKHICSADPTGSMAYKKKTGAWQCICLRIRFVCSCLREWPASRTYSGQSGRQLYSRLHVSVLCHAAAGPYGVHHRRHMSWQNGGVGTARRSMQGTANVRRPFLDLLGAALPHLHANRRRRRLRSLAAPGRPVRRHALWSSSFPRWRYCQQRGDESARTTLESIGKCRTERTCRHPAAPCIIGARRVCGLADVVLVSIDPC